MSRAGDSATTEGEAEPPIAWLPKPPGEVEEYVAGAKDAFRPNLEAEEVLRILGERFGFAVGNREQRQLHTLGLVKRWAKNRPLWGYEDMGTGYVNPLDCSATAVVGRMFLWDEASSRCNYDFSATEKRRVEAIRSEVWSNMAPKFLGPGQPFSMRTAGLDPLGWDIEVPPDELNLFLHVVCQGMKAQEKDLERAGINSVTVACRAQSLHEQARRPELWLDSAGSGQRTRMSPIEPSGRAPPPNALAGWALPCAVDELEMFAGRAMQSWHRSGPVTSEGLARRFSEGLVELGLDVKGALVPELAIFKAMRNDYRGEQWRASLLTRDFIRSMFEPWWIESGVLGAGQFDERVEELRSLAMAAAFPRKVEAVSQVGAWLDPLRWGLSSSIDQDSSTDQMLALGAVIEAMNTQEAALIAEEVQDLSLVAKAVAVQVKHSGPGIGN